MREQQNFNPEAESEEIDLNRTYKSPYVERLPGVKKELPYKKSDQTIQNRDLQTQEMESVDANIEEAKVVKRPLHSDTAKVSIPKKILLVKHQPNNTSLVSFKNRNKKLYLKGNKI